MRDTSMWVLPTGYSYSQTAPSWVLSRSGSPSGIGCSSVGPPQGHRSCQQTCSSVGYSLHGSTGPGRSLLQRGLPMVSQPPSAIHLLRCGVLHGLQVDICSTVVLNGLQGDSQPHHGLLHGLRGNLCSSARSTSSPSSALTLVSAVVSLTYSHSHSAIAVILGFFPSLYVITEVLPLSLMGSALASSGSVLEPAGIGSVGHRGSF